METVVIRDARFRDGGAIGAMVSASHGSGARTIRRISALEQTDSGVRRILLSPNVAWCDRSCSHPRNICGSVASMAGGVACESPFCPIPPGTDSDALRMAAPACAASVAPTGSSTFSSDGMRPPAAILCGPARLGTCRANESGSGMLRRLRHSRVIGLVVTAFAARSEPYWTSRTVCDARMLSPSIGNCPASSGRRCGSTQCQSEFDGVRCEDSLRFQGVGIQAETRLDAAIPCAARERGNVHPETKDGLVAVPRKTKSLAKIIPPTAKPSPQDLPAATLAQSTTKPPPLPHRSTRVNRAALSVHRCRGRP
jgi:hypothetical protein